MGLSEFNEFSGQQPDTSVHGIIADMLLEEFYEKYPKGSRIDLEKFLGSKLDEPINKRVTQRWEEERELKRRVKMRTGIALMKLEPLLQLVRLTRRSFQADRLELILDNETHTSYSELKSSGMRFITSYLYAHFSDEPSRKILEKELAKYPKEEDFARAIDALNAWVHSLN